MNEANRKIIVFGPNDKMYDKGTAVFYDVIHHPDMEYHCFFPDLKESKKLAYAFSNKVTHYVPRVVRKRIYANVLKHDYLKSCRRDDDILFVFSMYKMEDEPYFDNFLSFLKTEYRNAKFVYYSYDIASTWHVVTPEYIKANFDLVLTFDESDAKEYGFEFYEGIYSKVPVEDDDSVEESDVMFIGADKGKFPLLIKTFKVLSDKGIKCDFRLVEVGEENENYLKEKFDCDINEKGVIKIDYKGSRFYANEYCPYYKTLRVLHNSKAMLDIPLGTQKGSTIRLAEASVYEKKLITNCREVCEKPFYRKENILIVNDPGELEPAFLETPFVEIDHDFSPLAMIDYAQKKLSSING